MENQVFKNEVVSIIVGLSFRVLYIDDRYFIVKEFIPADEHVAFHQFKGGDITQIVHSFPSVASLNENQISSIANKITDLEIVKINYSKDYKWKLYLP